jgi:hypothetical protein
LTFWERTALAEAFTDPVAAIVEADAQGATVAIFR